MAIALKGMEMNKKPDMVMVVITLFVVSMLASGVLVIL
jgi:hypothetical protein